MSHRTRAKTIKGTSTRRQCEELGKQLGVTVSGYNPGGGTKVRVHIGTNKDWFDSHAIFATSGQPGDWAKCLIFLNGFKEGFLSGYGEGQMVIHRSLTAALDSDTITK